MLNEISYKIYKKHLHCGFRFSGLIVGILRCSNVIHLMVTTSFKLFHPLISDLGQFKNNDLWGFHFGGVCMELVKVQLLLV